MKATLRSAVLLGIAALGMVVASIPGFAEVQNVKVSGDVTVRAFHRECLDLNCGDDNLGTGALAAGKPLEGEDDFFMHTIGVNVAADLTENVSAFIRLANERDWDSTVGANSAAQDVDLSQGYVTLKELFYSPLTLRVGTQPIVWGRGLVLGSNLLPTIIGRPNDANGSITANEFTDFTSFDALRATLDLSGVTGNVPLTLDAVYIKLDENTTTLADDVNLMGVDFGTKFDSMNGEMEAYYLNKRDKVAESALDVDARDGSVNTIGLRGSARPAEGASVWGELAYQFGKRATDFEAILQSGDSQQAWAANFGTDFTFTDVAMTPKVGAEWKFFSGKNRDGAVMGWHPIAPGYYTTALREFQTRSTIAATRFYPNTQAGVTSGQTNQHELAVLGSLKPIEDLTVNQRLSWFVLPVGALPPSSSSNAKRESFLGTEWDTQLTYDYTDDVQFGVIYGLFLPGSVYNKDAVGVTGGNDTAQELITSVSVKF